MTNVKNTTIKFIAVIAALMLAFVVLPYAQPTYAESDIDITGDGAADFSDVIVEPTYGNESLKDVIPVQYNKLELRIEKANDLTDEEKEWLASGDDIASRTVLDSKYYRPAFYADGNKITKELKNGGVDITFNMADSQGWYVLALIYSDDTTCTYSPKTGKAEMYGEYDFNDSRMGLFKVDIQKSLDNAKISGITNKEYTGKPVVQKNIKVTCDGVTLVEDKDYGVSYRYLSNIDVGMADIHFSGLGIYEGFVNRLFKIIPAKAAIKSLVVKKKALKVNIAKKAAQYGTKKFQVRYKVKGTNKWKTKTTTSRTPTLTKLKKGKRYVVQVRAYKNKSYVGKWSLAKTSKKVK